MIKACKVSKKYSSFGAYLLGSYYGKNIPYITDVKGSCKFDSYDFYLSKAFQEGHKTQNLLYIYIYIYIYIDR